MGDGGLRATTERRAVGREAAARKSLHGFGDAGVLQLSESGEGGTFRVVFTVRFGGVIYVLHAFQKKSKRGVKTPPAELERVQTRLKMARQFHEERHTDDHEAETDSG